MYGRPDTSTWESALQTLPPKDRWAVQRLLHSGSAPLLATAIQKGHAVAVSELVHLPLLLNVPPPAGESKVVMLFQVTGPFNPPTAVNWQA